MACYHSEMFVQASEAARLTGLTEHQIKEWCVRRSLLPPEVRPGGRGRHAMFGWRSLLALRILREIHIKFGGTVSHWGPILAQWCDSIAAKPFHSLYGHLIIFEEKTVRITRTTPNASSGPFLALPLDNHLAALACGGIPSSEDQRPLLKPHLVTR